jgi:septal ring factor EnvC (AmiA/AmiB activator)
MAIVAKTAGEIAARRKDVDDARAVLAKGRDALGQLVDRRNQLIAQMLHDDNGGAAPASQPGSEAGDVADLIKRSDAAIDQRDKKLLARLRTLLTVPGKPPPAISDPTRPKSLRALDAPGAQMIWPVAGAMVYGFGDADAAGQTSRGMTLQAMPNGLIVTPFDGQVVYAGASRDNGVILIIRHGGGYHSVLAGFGHVDVTAGQWLLAGEPVGSQPDAKDKGASATFYFELRRDERPIDPQPRLVSRDQRTEETRVRQ